MFYFTSSLYHGKLQWDHSVPWSWNTAFYVTICLGDFLCQHLLIHRITWITVQNSITKIHHHLECVLLVIYKQVLVSGVFFFLFLKVLQWISFHRNNNICSIPQKYYLIFLWYKYIVTLKYSIKWDKVRASGKLWTLVGVFCLSSFLLLPLKESSQIALFLSILFFFCIIYLLSWPNVCFTKKFLLPNILEFIYDLSPQQSHCHFF